MARLKEEYGDDFHPIMKLAQNCVFLQEDADNEEDLASKVAKVKTANAEWARIAEYTEPKLKATDLTVEGEEGIIVQIVQFEDTIIE